MIKIKVHEEKVVLDLLKKYGKNVVGNFFIIDLARFKKDASKNGVDQKKAIKIAKKFSFAQTKRQVRKSRLHINKKLLEKSSN